LNVGDIWKAIDGFANDEPLLPIVKAVDNTAWEMSLSFSPAPQLDPNKMPHGIFVQMTHPDLASVVDDDRPISALRLRLQPRL
jgi:hypothetical protein